MIDDVALYLGLTRTQLQILKCGFPFDFTFHPISCDDISVPEEIELMLSSAWCVFLNPKRLTPVQLRQILDAHAYAIRHTHAAILLFTEPFTADQEKSVNTKELHRVNLRSGINMNLRNVIKIVCKGRTPCWDGMARMRSNMFNDGWYLLDMETSGTDPLEDDVISLTVSYMANYKLLSSETIYIRQSNPVSEKIEKITGITNEMLENGVTKEQTVYFLNHPPYPAPIITEQYDYFLPFLKALYHACDQKFDLPNISIDCLAAIVFGYTVFRKPFDVLSVIERTCERAFLGDPYTMKLYDLVCAVFKNLPDKYDVRSPGDFHKLYKASIECGE